jgi:hypothetical protein
MVVEIYYGVGIELGIEISALMFNVAYYCKAMVGLRTTCVSVP